MSRLQAALRSHSPPRRHLRQAEREPSLTGERWVRSGAAPDGTPSSLPDEASFRDGQDRACTAVALLCFRSWFLPGRWPMQMATYLSSVFWP